MPDAPDHRADRDEVIDSLLALPDHAQQIKLLRRRDLLDAEGLDTLLDRADDLLNRDPGRARKLAELCMELAEPAGAPTAFPRASYVAAIAYDANGEFEKALELICLSHESYVELGMNLRALRVEAGKLAVLLDLGCYQEMLSNSQELLKDLLRYEVSSSGSDAHAVQLILALVHQNRGLCYEHTGIYDQADRSYSESERIFKSLDMPQRVSEINSNRGILQLDLGRCTEALTVFEEAAKFFAETELPVYYAGALINIGYTNARLGNYLRSLECFEKARGILNPSESLVDYQRLLLDTANTYASLNLYSESIGTYREARNLLKGTGMVHEQALATWGLGSVLAQSDKFDEAETALVEAQRLFQQADNTPLLVNVMLERAALYARFEERRTALEIASKALRSISERSIWPLQYFHAHLEIAELTLPDVRRAELYLSEVEDLLTEIALPQLRYRFNECLARIQHRKGRYKEAVRLYTEAINEIESLRVTVASDLMRSSILKDKTSVYEGMLDLYLESSHGMTDSGIRKSFELTEQAKSRALTDLLSGIIPHQSVTTESYELRERLKTLQADLGALYDDLLVRKLESKEDSVQLPKLQTRVSELETEISRLKLQIDASGVEPPDPFEIPAMRKTLSDRLPANIVLLAYHILGGEVLAFVMLGDEVRVKRSVGNVERVRSLQRKLDSQWDRFRSGQTFSERQMVMLEKSTRRVLAALYDEIFHPVESLLEEAVSNLDLPYGKIPKLVIVPHGPLHQTPFHAFFDGEKYLLDRFEVSYAPSATLFALGQEKETRPLNRAVALGVSDDLIPTAREEASAVAGLFPASEVLLDERATTEALVEAVTGCGVLHMACHGMFRSDNPMFSALKLHEGWLLAHDAMGLDLDGAVVTLSACESGRNVVVGGDEILGLTRAFLGARAATLLVSLWIVHDDTTSSLMRRFYGHLISGVSPARALREAQLETREEHPHPYFWAPFVAVGKR